VALGGGSVRRGWHHLGWLWRLGSSSEPVKMEHSWALSAIGDVVGSGHLAWGKGGGGLGRDLLGRLWTVAGESLLAIQAYKV